MHVLITDIAYNKRNHDLTQSEYLRKNGKAFLVTRIA